MAGTVRKVISLLVPATKAQPSPALGQSLGGAGVNMVAFCREFNLRSQLYKEGIPLRVKLIAKMDGSFEFTTKLPQSSWFLLQMSGAEKGALRPTKEWMGTVHAKEIYELAKLKSAEDQNSFASIESWARQLSMTAQHCGLKVVTWRSDSSDASTPNDKA